MVGLAFSLTTIVVLLIGALLIWKPKLLGKKRWHAVKTLGFVVLIVGGLGVFGVISIPNILGGAAQPVTVTPGNNYVPYQPTTTTTCPSGGTSTVSFKAYNVLNATADEAVTMGTGYIYAQSGGAWIDTGKTLSDTSTPGNVTLNCGVPYKVYFVATAAARSFPVSVRSGAAVLDSDGAITFTPTTAEVRIEFNANKRDVLYFKARDMTQDAWMYAYNQDSASRWQPTGNASFGSNADNQTQVAVSTAKFEPCLYLESYNVSTDWVDKYMLVALELNDDSARKWDAPVVTFNGNMLTNVKGSLTPEELISSSITSAEDVYKITSPILSNSDNKLCFVLTPKSGQDPSADINVTILNAGNYRGLGSTIKVGAVKDDTSSTVVYTASGANFLVS